MNLNTIVSIRVRLAEQNDIGEFYQRITDEAAINRLFEQACEPLPQEPESENQLIMQDGGYREMNNLGNDTFNEPADHQESASQKDDNIDPEKAAAFVAQQSALYEMNSPGAKRVVREGAPRRVSYKPYLGL